LFIGTAGWSLPSTSAFAFPPAGSHLQRYSAVFNAVEINSSFYRAHRRETYERWSSTVPAEFAFSVKLPREITHDLRLRTSAEPLEKFFDEIAGLGSRLRCVLMQLPPSLPFDRETVEEFLTLVRNHYRGAAVFEPRHITWFEPTVEEVLHEFEAGRAGTDPALCAEARKPMPNATVAYYRLHGSPRMYYSDYDETFLASVVNELTETNSGVSERWCIFDNTAHGFATANALRVLELLRSTERQNGGGRDA
jgi:uncharacterized protein YecE (DUF72 family)